MAPSAPHSFQMPSFLQGTYPELQRKTRAEGQRCAAQYRLNGSIPAPRELLTVPIDTVVVAHEVIDFQRERPAWRLYMVSNVLSTLREALQWKGSFAVADTFESCCRETAWGALYFTLSQMAPMNAERNSLRLQAVLRFWEPLQSARYLFKNSTAVLSLDALMTASCDWAMEAWCPEGATTVRSRLEIATERMARATREDCIEAILRQMPKALAHAQKLKHRDVLANPASMRQHLTTLDLAAFERMSAACTSDLLEHLYDWDHQLGMH